MPLYCAICGYECTMLCSRCRAVAYCTPEHQKEDWKNHKPACVPPPSTSSITTTTSSESRTHIGIVDIGSTLPDFHFPLRDAITARAPKVTYLSSLSTTPTLLAESPSPFSALWVCNAKLMKAPDLLAALISYAKAGGTVVLGGYLQSEMGTNKYDDLFVALHLPWRVSGYHRTTHALQKAHPLASTLGSKVVKNYSMKSVFLKNVPVTEALYRPASGARAESLAVQLAGGGDPDSQETPIAVGKLGEGWIAWVGDVNAEEGTTSVTLGLLGLGDA